MGIRKKKYFEELRIRGILAFVSFFLYYAVLLITDKKYWEFYINMPYPIWNYSIDATLTFITILALVSLSVGLGSRLIKSYYFRQNTIRSLIIYNITIFIINIASIYFISMALISVFGTYEFYLSDLYVCSIMITFMSGMYSSIHYLKIKQQAEKKRMLLEIKYINEHEKAERARTELLKIQIDPHFMFNNFSILTELINEDRDIASKFLGQLSKVYRYIITNLKQDIVPIEEEINFLRSYIYLISIRYEDTIKVNIARNIEKSQELIPPVSLQLLVENAIKHNTHSEIHPLTISIFREDKNIVVENNLQPMAFKVPSTGIGQTNIIDRYAMLSDDVPVFEQTNDKYIVKLPIISQKK